MHDSLLPTLRLLLLVAGGTILLPTLTSLAVGTDMPSLWAVQGLFSFILVMVCSARSRISQFHRVNLAIFVAAVALLAAFVGAPVHAVYRNTHGYEEGRSFYKSAALEVTRLWHLNTRMPLRAISGDDALAFGAAFYSADHPYYAPPAALQVSRTTIRERGWAALCFADQTDCIQRMKIIAERAGPHIHTRFEVQSHLLGIPGVKREVVAIIVPPYEDELSPTPAGSSEDFSAIRRSSEQRSGDQHRKTNQKQPARFRGNEPHPAEGQ